MSNQSLTPRERSGVTPGRVVTSLACLAKPLLHIAIGVLLSATAHTIAYAQIPDSSDDLGLGQSVMTLGLGNGDTSIVVKGDKDLTRYLFKVMSSKNMTEKEFSDSMMIYVGQALNSPSTAIVVKGDTIRDEAARHNVLSALLKEVNEALTGNSLADKKHPLADRSRIALLSPVSIVDSKSHVATLHIVNPTRDSVPLDFVLRSSAPQQSQPKPSTELTAQASPLHGAVADTQWSLAGWIHDVPKGVVLAPYETLTVTMHVTVPEKIKPGKYSAQVVLYYKPTLHIDALTDLSGNIFDFFSDTTANGFPVSRYVLGEIVYTKKKSGTSKQSAKGLHERGVLRQPVVKSR